MQMLISRKGETKDISKEGERNYKVKRPKLKYLVSISNG